VPFAVRPDAVHFRLDDDGYADVRLHQALERPRDGPPFALRDGFWELTFRRPQVDRLEYGIAADGEERERGAIEFAEYVPPAWLAAPDPGPATAVDDLTRIWAPPDTSRRAPLPLLVVHDGTAYEREAQLTRLIAHAIATDRIPRCRVALLDSPRRDDDYSASARYGRALAARLPALAPATAHAGLGASLGALALVHARALHPGAFGALMLQSGSYFRRRWDGHEAGFARFNRIARFVGRMLDGAPATTPIPIAITCGAPEENLANNRAMAAALRRQGHHVTFTINRDAHNYVAWRDALDPHLPDLLARAWG
jgi:enterochelin esterase family protein